MSKSEPLEAKIEAQLREWAAELETLKAKADYEHQARRRDPTRQPPRVQRDTGLCGHIARVWREHREVYGVRKVWKQLLREGIVVARCTVARLMRRLGLAGAVRGRAWRRTTIPETAAPRPPDLVTRQFTATRPNQLWVADLTYVATWRGFVYRSIRYTERLGEAGIELSVGSTGDSYDNALAETVIGLFKTEEIYRRGPWKGLEDVEFAPLEWVAWYNRHRLLAPLGYVPPAEFEQAYHDRQTAPASLAVLT